MTRFSMLRRIAAAAVAAGSGIVPVVVVAAPAAAEPQLIDTISCNSPDPWSSVPLRIAVDVYSNIEFPKDGARPPVLYLSANTLRSASLFEYTVETTVRWTNTSTGAIGKVILPSRGHSVNWEGSLQTGRGNISFIVHQKIGALAFVPMVNPQYSSCSGSATVWNPGSSFDGDRVVIDFLLPT